MIQDETVKWLMKISTPKTFKSQEYICYEGQPGNEMYIILKGCIGVYVANLMGEQTEVSRIMAGDFFGEMSIFDNLPRSASCVALDDVVCVAIGKDKLTEFFTSCPELTLKVFENMSGRIRRMDNLLCKTNTVVKNNALKPFSIPSEYEFSHYVAEPEHDSKYLEGVAAECPICGKNISVINVKRKIMSLQRMRIDGRILYKECDPLWYDIWSCPYCHYSNHYLSFFKMLPFKREQIKRILEQQHRPELAKATDFKTPFDQLFIRYLQAIHINQAVNANDNFLIGHLWTSLYWLFEETGDVKMGAYCRNEAISYLSKAIEDNSVTGASSRQNVALTLANMYASIDDKKNALRMCDIAAEGDDGQVKTIALRLRDRL